MVYAYFFLKNDQCKKESYLFKIYADNVYNLQNLLYGRIVY